MSATRIDNVKQAITICVGSVLAAVLLAAPTAAQTPDPIVRVETMRAVAKGVWVVPDDKLVPLVPNVGIVEGRDAILVVDTGLGRENGAAVHALAERLARGRRILLATTHFHPEHSSGASAFNRAEYITSAAQAVEIRQKSATLDEQFKSFGSGAARALRDFSVVVPGQTYTGEKQLELGGRIVILREMPAHTRGDQIIEVPDAGVIFTGDLVEERSFPVLYDIDARGARWIADLKALTAMNPNILVPGHGHVGDVGLIAPEIAYLERVQAEVGRAARRGQSQEQATRTLTPRFAALHPDWQFKDLIPFEIAIFYAEATHRVPKMASA
jgi:glyoxylase-like metal-dependent hydrolase (beta-lactamase superfamily II)